MAIITRTVQSHGIFHGLPTFPDHDGKKYSAIVTGANGISGAHLVDVLSQAPDRWTKIYALSRKPSAIKRANVHSIAIDFLSSEPKDIARVLKENNVSADYIFFSSYVQPPPKQGERVWSNAEELEEQNVTLLSSFLSALSIASVIPKRFVLQTGAKHYGAHLGPGIVPYEESEPRPKTAPNFYFPQEDLLFEWTKENKTTWTVTRPGFILGAVTDAAMNMVYSLAIYAAIQKELGKPLEFPGNIAAWDTEKDQSMSALLAYFTEWAALTEGAADQALNMTDGSAFAWGKFWPVLAKWYGVGYSVPETDKTQYDTLEMPFEPPPRGFGPRGKIEKTGSFLEWSSRADVQRAWSSIQTRYQLVQNPFDDPVRNFGLLDIEILGPWARPLSMDKSRKLGWNGFVDTKDAIKHTIQGLASLKMVPPLEGN